MSEKRDNQVFSRDDHDRYIRYVEENLRLIGQEIALKFPKLYGNVQFNVQGGTCVNVNVLWGIRTHEPRNSDRKKEKRP